MNYYNILMINNKNGSMKDLLELSYTKLEALNSKAKERAEEGNLKTFSFWRIIYPGLYSTTRIRPAVRDRLVKYAVSTCEYIWTWQGHYHSTLGAQIYTPAMTRYNPSETHQESDPEKASPTYVIIHCNQKRMHHASHLYWDNFAQATTPHTHLLNSVRTSIQEDKKSKFYYFCLKKFVEQYE